MKTHHCLSQNGHGGYVDAGSVDVTVPDPVVRAYLTLAIVNCNRLEMAFGHRELRHLVVDGITFGRAVVAAAVSVC